MTCLNLNDELPSGLTLVRAAAYLILDHMATAAALPATAPGSLIAPTKSYGDTNHKVTPYAKYSEALVPQTLLEFTCKKP